MIKNTCSLSLGVCHLKTAKHKKMGFQVFFLERRMGIWGWCQRNNKMLVDTHQDAIQSWIWNNKPSWLKWVKMKILITKNDKTLCWKCLVFTFVLLVCLYWEIGIIKRKNGLDLHKCEIWHWIKWIQLRTENPPNPSKVRLAASFTYAS